jgi:hypothetical protein
MKKRCCKCKKRHKHRVSYRACRKFPGHKRRKCYRVRRKASRRRRARGYSFAVGPLKLNPRRHHVGTTLSVPEQHQLRVARRTLELSDVGALVLGGPTKAEAREIIRRLTGREPRENPRRRRATGTSRTAARRFRLRAGL